jgi:hypothetical protein
MCLCFPPEVPCLEEAIFKDRDGCSDLHSKFKAAEALTKNEERQNIRFEIIFDIFDT